MSQVIVNVPLPATAGEVSSLDTMADGAASQVTVAPFLHTYVDLDDPENPAPLLIQTNELQIVNATTGVTTYLLGMKNADLTTIRQHGGSTQIGQLSKNEGGLAFDFSTRQPGAQTVTMTTPALAAGNHIDTSGNAAQFVLDVVNYPTMMFHGLTTMDSITINVAAPMQTVGVNHVAVDASTLVGTLNVDAMGGASAKRWSLSNSPLGALSRSTEVAPRRPAPRLEPADWPTSAATFRLTRRSSPSTIAWPKERSLAPPRQAAAFSR